jgi:nucleoside-diphosphate-sugar epimerase
MLESAAVRSKEIIQIMKIAVTGGSGKVGKAVLEVLAARGHELLNLDRRPANDRPAKFVYAELARREMVQPALEQVEALIHMGEIANARQSAFTIEEIYARNTAACSMVMQVAADLKLKRALYISTVQVYGYADVGAIPPAMLPIDESHPLRPQNVYGLSKVANEMYCRLLFEKAQLPVSIFRPPWILTQEPGEDWFRWTDSSTKADESLGVYVRDRDFAELLALAIERPATSCEAYNVSADEVLTGVPVREAAARNYPQLPPLPADWGRFQSPYLAEKAKRDFGWRPAYNFMEDFRKRYGREPQPAKPQADDQKAH